MAIGVSTPQYACLVLKSATPNELTQERRAWDVVGVDRNEIADEVKQTVRGSVGLVPHRNLKQITFCIDLQHGYFINE